MWNFSQLLHHWVLRDSSITDLTFRGFLAGTPPVFFVGSSSFLFFRYPIVACLEDQLIDDFCTSSVKLCYYFRYVFRSFELKGRKNRVWESLFKTKRIISKFYILFNDTQNVINFFIKKWICSLNYLWISKKNVLLSFWYDINYIY